jgi:hypothetical protein
MKKHRLSVYLDKQLMAQVTDLASWKRQPKSVVAEAAIASFVTPDDSDRREAAFARRLDRLTRQVERLERDTRISIEALGLFVRFWLTVTPPLPDSAQAAANAKGRERFEHFVEALGRRLAKGQSLADEVLEDIAAEERVGAGSSAVPSDAEVEADNAT